MRLPGLVLLGMAASASILALQEPGVGPSSSFAGPWTGSGKFTAGDPSTPCQYTGTETPPAVLVDLLEKEGGWSGKVVLDLAGTTEPPCAPIKARYRILDSRVSGNSLTFTDAAGNDWSLTLREGRLQGIVSSPRLSGEVSLARGGEPQGAPPAVAGGAAPSARGPSAKAPASPAPAAAGKPAAHGSTWGGIATVAAVTVGGAAAFYGVNKALQDTKGSQNAAPTCSPRACVLGGAGAPCDDVTPGSCHNNITTGGSCGTTVSGVPVGGRCSLPALPCQSDLSCICQEPSCNNSICQSTESCAFGRAETTHR